MSRFQLYGKENIQEFCSSSTYEQDYILPFIQQKTSHWMSNIETQMYLFKTATQIFPLTVNQTEYKNSYVCSPYTTYISYAKEELYTLKQPILEKGLACLITSLGQFFKWARVNQAVHVNNWLLSTNLYPAWEGEDLLEITPFLLQKFPQHLLIFRSLNRYTNEALYAPFERAGYKMIPSRQVYIFDARKENYLNRPNTKWDLKLLEKKDYTLVFHESFREADFSRMEWLYRRLYLDKYSYLNPQFTEAYLRLCHQKNLLQMYGLRSKEGELEAILGYFCRNGVLTVPLVGYNTSLPQKEGLYRRLMALALREAFEKKQVLNLSSGASHFKILRGGVGIIEHSAVYEQHLPFFRRLPWGMLKIILDSIGVPLMKKYQL